MKGAPSGLRKFLAAKSPRKMMKNVFYFTLKLFSFSRNLNFCFDFSFIYCEIVSWETKGSNNKLPNIKGNQTMEFGQSIEYNMIFLEKSYTKYGEKTILRPFSTKSILNISLDKVLCSLFLLTYNLKNLKNTHGWVLLLIKFEAKIRQLC